MRSNKTVALGEVRRDFPSIFVAIRLCYNYLRPLIITSRVTRKYVTKKIRIGLRIGL
jgi:hypothetical protein